MKKAIEVINELESQGVITRYAIAGGMAVLFYTEPVLTYDLDIFCFLPGQDRKIVTLSPIYEKLRELGYGAEKEHVAIEGMPVQFIPAYNDLIEDAVTHAVDIVYEGVKTRVMSLEHVIAVMLQTFRPKDRERILVVLDEAKIDETRLEAILEKYGLKDRWEQLTREPRDEKLK